MAEQHQILLCLQLEHFSKETVWVIQKAAAMGNWWAATSSWQHARSCITLLQNFWRHQITQVTQLSYSPDLAPWDFWLFQKLKSPLKGRDFRPSMRFRKIWQGSWWQLGELCESQGAYFDGAWGVVVLCTMFLRSFSVNVSIFHSMWLNTFWTDFICYSFHSIFHGF